MKLRYTFLYIFSIITISIFAQTETRKIQLTWTDIEKWSNAKSSIDVIHFNEAQYPTDNHLPYFNLSFDLKSGEDYNIEIKNKEYLQLTSAETQLISKLTIPDNIETLKNITNERGNKKVIFDILPFITVDNKILKLKSFELVITKTSGKQKVATSSSRTYASSSVLAQGRFYKVKVTESGIYKLTYEDLSSMGVSPANVRVFGYGGGVLDQNFQNSKIDDLPEASIYMNKGSDGVFNAGDYILFYAQGVTKWSYDKYKSMFTHTINPYSKYGYYFITSDAGTGKKIEEQATTVPQDADINPVTEFTDYQVHEKETFNLIESGREYLGETFNDVLTYNFSFSTPNAISSIARLDVVSSSILATTFNLSLNNAQQKTLNVSAMTSDNYTFGISGSGIYTFSSPTDNSTYNITYNKAASTNVGYLNYLEVNTRRTLKMVGNCMQFQNTDYLGNETYNKYLLSNASSSVEIWDITDQQNIFKVQSQYSSGVVTFTGYGSEVRNYLAIDPTAKSSFSSPTSDGVIDNQDLHAIDQADFLIITHPRFLTQAQELAKLHQDKDNISVAVVTTDQVYNEFSSGTPDATAYRWMAKMLYDRASQSGINSNLPKYLLLFGRGTYDNRKITSSSGDNLILTYQAENSLITTSSYVTDDYFGLLDDEEGTSLFYNSMDVGVGRFPVTTVAQAENVVNKIKTYMDNDSKGFWKNQLCYVADDGDQATHSKDADSVATAVAKKFPAYQINKIYLDAFQQEVSASGESYPLAKSKLSNLISSGILLLNYNGHAGATGWANEQILTTNDVKTLSNSHLPLFYGATCDFLQFDVAAISGGENVLLNPSGAGIGIISAARPVYAGPNRVLDQAFCTNLFKKVDGSHMGIGEVLMIAKNQVGNDNGNKLPYFLMGDPALKLEFPTDYQIITSQINNSTTLGTDTLRAMSVATIQGYIADADGNKVTTFNGNLHANVYDKIQKLTTLNNHSDGALTYYDRPSTLFSGNAEVKAGEFTFTFMLPKDIKYNYGGGRINYYAEDDTNNKEAQGYFEDFTIGGSDKSVISETDGPDMSLYLNSTNFVSGNKVNETPLFFANLADQHGINTVGGSGIGHDITLVIDDDPSQTYVLNDYFTANANSYTEGVVQYKLPTMDDGKHTLSLRAWDLLNNSTTKTTEFEVVTGLTPTIFTVTNYPNPVKTSSSTEFVINHDRPETVLSTVVEIFDLTGRKIWTFAQSSADNVTWDLKGSDGIKVKAGMYLYRISIKTANSDLTSKSNKILITE